MRRSPRPVPGKPRAETRRGIPDALLADRYGRQGGRCAVCSRVMAPPVIDHDHELARRHPHPEASYCVQCWRSLVCGHCNSMLGFARDDPEVMERGAALVRAFRESWQT